MRKLSAGLMVVGLLVAMAAPAMADQGGADPLGLTLSGAVIPYVGAAATGLVPGSLSFLEISSPVGDNSNLHLLFYDVTCARQGPSIPNPLTTNDVDFRRVDNLGGVPNDGLIAIGAAPTGLEVPLFPLKSPLHLRMLWANAAGNYFRVLEPIQAQDVSQDGCDSSGVCTGGARTWSPLKTGATFFAPPVAPAIPGLDETIYFVCPTSNIISGSKSGAALASNNGFPFFEPTCPPGSPGTCIEPVGTPAPLRVLIFDDEETPLRDTTITCTCLTATPVTKISDVYTSLAEAPGGTYTKIFGEEFVPATTSVTCDTSVPPDCGCGCGTPTATCAPGVGNWCGGSTSPDCPVDGNTGCRVKETTKPIPAGFVFHPFTSYRALRLSPPFLPAGLTLDNFGRNSQANGCNIFPGFVTGPCPDR